MRQATINAIRERIAALKFQMQSGNTQYAIDDLQRIIDQRGTELDRDGIKQRNELAADPAVSGLFVSPHFKELQDSFARKTTNTPAPDALRSALPNYHALLMQRYRNAVLARAQVELEQLQKELQTQRNAIKATVISAGGDPRGFVPPVVALTPEQREERRKLNIRIESLSKQIDTIKNALSLENNKAPLIRDEDAASFNQLAQNVDLNANVQAAADELVHDCLIQDPFYTESLKAQAAADMALGKLDKVTADNFDACANAVLEELKKVKATLPEENKRYAASHKIYGQLAQGVPYFNRDINTHFATQGKPISKGFETVYNQLEQLLYAQKDGINALLKKVEALSAELSAPTLSKSAAQAKTEELNAAIEKLQTKAQDFNEFLLRYSIRDGKGLSMLSSIHQNTLDQLADFAEQLLKDTNTKAKRVKEFQLTLADTVEAFIPSLLVEKLWNAAHKAADNRDSQTLIGRQDSGRHNTLVSNPDILNEYGKECYATLHSGTGFTGLNHRVEEEKMTDDNGNLIQLPIHGDDKFGDQYSVINLVAKVFPKNPQKHMRWSADGKTLSVMWRDNEEKDRWLKALKKCNAEYVTAKSKATADELDAAVTIPKEPLLDAALPVGKNGKAPFSPPLRAGHDVPAAEHPSPSPLIGPS